MAFIHHQLWPLSPVIPAGTPASSPVSTPWNIVQGHCDGFRVQVPNGHNGLTGFKIVYNGQQIIPWSNNAWLVGSGDTFSLPWGEEIMATGLVFTAYNTDLVAHQFWALADVRPVLGEAPASFASTIGPSLPSPATLRAVAALTG